MRMLRVLGLALGALIALFVLAVAGVLASGYLVATAQHPNPVRDLHVVADKAAIARGFHLAELQCAGCHSADGEPPLSGGRDDYFAEPGGPPFGHLVAPNLTAGGLLAQYSDGELARAIREGVARDGRGLLVMPSKGFHDLSDSDLAAIIACMRSQPAVTHATPPRGLSPVAYLALGLRMMAPSTTPAITAPVADVPPDTTAGYGSYMVKYLGCADCHGADLHGGRKGQFEPLGPNLVEIASHADRPAFERAVRAGVSTKDGHALDPAQMPWTSFRHLDPTEVAAVQNYLKSLAKP
ncbi:MAG TPA: c-type cytochrome [Candidatus Acidoferrales bacterium]|nr:c-type cytochrome [Candidatus Acidoferrales bacterium]